MKNFVAITNLILILILSGCAAVPQTPVALNQELMSNNTGRIGVAMTVMPKVDTRFPGADCLLCLAAASLANKSLTEHTHTLTPDTLPELKKQLGDLLKRKGLDVVMIEDEVSIKDLKSYKAEGENVADKDFKPFIDKYQIDQLLMVDINALGFIRSYASYIPTSDPKAYLNATGFIVNLNTNTYDWYLPVAIFKSADGEWDEPKQFPGLTNAYYQAIETGKDTVIAPFLNNDSLPVTADAQVQ